MSAKLLNAEADLSATGASKCAVILNVRGHVLHVRARDQYATKADISIPNEKLHFAPSGIGGISPLGAGQRNPSAWCRPEESSRSRLEQICGRALTNLRHLIQAFEARSEI
ncbi:hypothetical protein OM416_26820 [Paenibacillus sp. LS1]|nr:hypothetical protein [Paenibacillus sp. LS1]